MGGPLATVLHTTERGGGGEEGVRKDTFLRSSHHVDCARKIPQLSDLTALFKIFALISIL